MSFMLKIRQKKLIIAWIHSIFCQNPTPMVHFGNHSLEKSFEPSASLFSLPFSLPHPWSTTKPARFGHQQVNQINHFLFPLSYIAISPKIIGITTKKDPYPPYRWQTTIARMARSFGTPNATATTMVSSYPSTLNRVSTPVIPLSPFLLLLFIVSSPVKSFA